MAPFSSRTWQPRALEGVAESPNQTAGIIDGSGLPSATTCPWVAALGGGWRSTTSASTQTYMCRGRLTLWALMGTLNLKDVGLSQPFKAGLQLF